MRVVPSMNTAVMFGKASDEWTTPQDCFDVLNAEFDFILDAAATKDNRKCFYYFGPDHQNHDLRDALNTVWWPYVDIHHRPVFVNPPYSRCREFIAKAALEARKGATVVCLVPSRTDTRWWHDHVWAIDRPYRGVEVRFIKGRLKFGGTGKADNSAPFPSCVVIFRPPTTASE